MRFLHQCQFVVAAALVMTGCSTVDQGAKSDHPANSIAFRSDAFIVEDGAPKAEIVISADPERPRMINLAALELQYYLEKMSGARLPIVTQPDETKPVKIYVGESEYTQKLGVNPNGLKFGAFHMESGGDWLALVGDDFDFTPPVPWNRSNTDLKRVLPLWDELVAKEAGSAWGFPFSLTYKKFRNPRGFDDVVAKRYGTDAVPVWNPRELKWKRDDQGPGGGQGFWCQDEGGSLNAVYALLRSLGVRWYMPEEIGEVVPERKTIPLPSVSLTERPDSELRAWYWYNYAMFPFEHVMWARRLGMNSGYQTSGYLGHAHGLSKIHAHKKMREAHPEYYSLYQGKRDTDFRGTGHACLSSPEFFDQTVKYARFMFDHYDEPQISLWPQDGFHHCRCPSCGEQSSSDLVWGFVDRVARELYKSHPDRLVTCGAYTPYIHPPKNVEKFPPNVVVMIANCGRPMMDDPKRWNSYWKRLEGWRKKVAPGNIMRVENNRYGLDRTFPVIHPRNMAKDLKALQGISRGECCEEAQAKGRWHSPGFDHLTLYVQGRMLWDANLDVENLLDEYYETFYGPVADEMREALEFAQANYSRSNVTKKGKVNPRLVALPVRIKFAEMLESARSKAGDTIYGKRIQAIIDELPPLETLREELAQKQAAGNPREKAPVVVARHVNDPEKPEPHTFTPRFGARFKDVVPKIPTTFTVTWDDDALVFDILCKEPDMKNLNVAKDVWEGDSLVLVLESPNHSFYQLEINPDGKLYDADRSGGGLVVPHWESMADVKTEKGEDFWRATVRIPIAVVGEDGAEGDPMNFVVGPKLGEGGAWWFNLARRRKRAGAEGGRRFQNITAVFSKSAPYHLRKFHDPDHFAKLEIKKKSATDAR